MMVHRKMGILDDGQCPLLSVTLGRIRTFIVAYSDGFASEKMHADDMAM
jgi:hypothetical protein